VTLLVVVTRGGIFLSVNQRYHVALIDWWRVFYAKEG